MEDDDVGFDADVPQRGDLGLEVAEGCDIRPVEIEFAVVAALVDVVKRLVLVEDVMLREHRHPQLVEAGGPHRFQRLALHVERLVGPGVAGRPEGEIRLAVGVGEVAAVAHPDRAVIAFAAAGRSETFRSGRRGL